MKFLTTSYLALLLALTAGLSANAPAETDIRLRTSFDDGWLFQRQFTGSGALGSFDRDTSRAAEVEPAFLDATKSAYDDTSWQRINLPHCWNAFDATDVTPGYWRGIGWYRKHFSLKPAYSSKRVFLYFEGVGMVSEFWLNGQRLGIHKSGFTSFEFDVTPYVRFDGADNVLTVKVDNLYHAEIPPTVKTDYTFYGGIYRHAWISARNPLYIDQVNWTTPSVSAEKGSLQIHTRLRNTTKNAQQLSLVNSIIDPQGKQVASLSTNVAVNANASSDLQQSAQILSPALWSPSSPAVYKILTTVTNASTPNASTPVDEVQNPLGFRWYEFDPQKGFYLNGKRLQLQGVNWHQSYPGMGNALPDSRQWKDFQLIREMGVNFWRTSHYPHAPVTMDAADKLGLLVWEELPVNKEIGNTDEYIANVKTMASEMIDRDRNHPSVIVWGIAGEVNAPQEIAKRVVASTVAAYRELDPSRPTAMHEPRGEDIEALVDVSGLGASKETDTEHARFSNRAFMTAEYSAALIGRAIYGGGTTSEEEGCEKHEAYLAQINKRPWLAGGAIWHAFDYDGETYDAVIPHIVSFGMTDIWRIPKEVYYFYQSQWSSNPMVHIVGHWTWNGHEGETRQVKIYSNAPEVELFLNQESLGLKKDLSGDLQHPPRLWDVVYKPGVLRAVGRFPDKEVTDERKTAGAPYQVLLQADVSTLRSGDRESLAYLTATIADQAGTPVPDSNQAVTFTLYGPGELLPQQSLDYGKGFTWHVVGGMTRIAFRSTARSGTAVVSAYVPGLRMGRTKIDVSSPGKTDEMDYIEATGEKLK